MRPTLAWRSIWSSDVARGDALALAPPRCSGRRGRRRRASSSSTSDGICASWRWPQCAHSTMSSSAEPKASVVGIRPCSSRSRADARASCAAGRRRRRTHASSLRHRPDVVAGEQPHDAQRREPLAGAHEPRVLAGPRWCGGCRRGRSSASIHTRGAAKPGRAAAPAAARAASARGRGSSCSPPTQRSSASTVAPCPAQISGQRASGHVTCRNSRFGAVCRTSRPPGRSTRWASRSIASASVGDEVLDDVAAEHRVEGRVRPRQRGDVALHDLGARRRRQRSRG